MSAKCRSQQCLGGGSRVASPVIHIPLPSSSLSPASPLPLSPLPFPLLLSLLLPPPASLHRKAGGDLVCLLRGAAPHPPSKHRHQLSRCFSLLRALPNLGIIPRESSVIIGPICPEPAKSLIIRELISFARPSINSSRRKYSSHARHG